MEKLIGNYWEEQGKYQDEVNRIEKITPDMCMTNNKYMNLYLIASKIYYDVYNNNGGNITECFIEDIEKYLLPFEHYFKMSFTGDPSKIRRRFCNKKTLENFMNRVIEIIKDEDLNYTQYTVYQDFENKQISKDFKKGFQKIIFGEEGYCNDWIRIRLNSSWGFKMI